MSLSFGFLSFVLIQFSTGKTAERRILAVFVSNIKAYHIFNTANREYYRSKYFHVAA